MKKLLKTTTSHVLFLILGISLTFALFTVRAAWDTQYSTGGVLTAGGFNDVVDKLGDLETYDGTLLQRIILLENAGGTSHDQSNCTWRTDGGWPSMYATCLDGEYVARINVDMLAGSPRTRAYCCTF